MTLRGPQTSSRLLRSPPAEIDLRIGSMFVLAVTQPYISRRVHLACLFCREFRKGPMTTREPPRCNCRNQVETSWTVIPVLGVLDSLVNARVATTFQNAARPTLAIEVTAIGPPVLVGVPYPRWDRRLPRITCSC